jgi:hypothetical protein
MSIEAKCPDCGTEFRRPDGMTSKLEKCPRCNKVMRLPSTTIQSTSDRQKTCLKPVPIANDVVLSEQYLKTEAAKGPAFNEGKFAVESNIASTPSPELNTHSSKKDFRGTVDPASLPEVPAMEILQAVALDEAVTRSAFWLLFWGAINLALWFCFTESRNTILKFNLNPGLSIYIVLYWDAVLSAIMIFFSLIGAFVKHRIIGIMYGVCIITIGIWNIFCIIIVDIVLTWNHIWLSPSINGGGIWIMLGLCQLSFGLWNIKRYSFLGQVNIVSSADVKAHAKKLLHALVSFTPELENGRLVFLTAKRFLFITLRNTYCVQLLPEQAIFIEKNLTRIFSIKRSVIAESMEALKGLCVPQQKSIFGEKIVTYELNDDEGHLWTGCIRGPSVDVFKVWCHGKLFKTTL